MKSSIVVDTSAIVAGIDRGDQWHAKARRLFSELPKPLLTCEVAWCEVCFLLAESDDALRRAFKLVTELSVVSIRFSLSEEMLAVEDLMIKYRDLPMSLADACLVRMSEIHNAPVLTFNSDFRIYRRNRGGVIPLIGID